MRKTRKRLTLTSETVANMSPQAAHRVEGANQRTLINGCSLETAIFACPCTLLETGCATLP